MTKAYYWDSAIYASRVSEGFANPSETILFDGKGAFYPKPIYGAPGFVTVVDLDSGKKFNYTVVFSDVKEEIFHPDASRVGEFEKENVVFLRDASGQPAKYSIGSKGIEHFELTLPQAARLQELSDKLHFAMPVIEGFGQRRLPKRPNIKAEPRG